MTDWRFLVVRHFGGSHQRQQTCIKIKRLVEQHGLSNVLPLVKYELGRQHEYYIGMAVDINGLGDGNNAEEEARRVLVNSGVTAAANRQISPLVEADQVQGLLRGTIECQSFTVPITYEASDESESIIIDWLQTEFDIGELQSAEPSSDENEKYTRLLHWCSATGSGELGRIQHACQVLGIATEWGGAWSLLRRLVLLGHMEFDGSASLRWSIIPPTLVTPGDDKSHRILVGQRTPTIVQYLRDHLQLEEHPQPNGPPCLLVLGETDEIYYKPSRQVQYAGSVSNQLSELLPTFENWKSRLPTWDERDFGRFSIEKYDLQANDFRNVPSISGKPQMGLYRFTFEQTNQRLVTLSFFDDHGDRWVCGDYYGLRFLERARYGLCRVIYLQDSHHLVIPVIDRWPMPYERALVLASGILPRRMQSEAGISVYAYEGITPEFASRMCTLMGLEMERN